MSTFLGFLVIAIVCGFVGVWVGYKEGRERYADTMHKYYPDITDYILKESRNGYDDEELEFRGELLRAKDRKEEA